MTYIYKNFIVLVLLSALSFLVASLKGYRAAVAEHSVVSLEEPTKAKIEKSLGDNLDLYEDLIGLAAANDAQIIVFPEFGLNPIDNQNRTELSIVAEEVPTVGTVPCFSNTGQIIKRMSCAAVEQNISVLVNMVDRVKHDDGEYLYNTNVVFDEGGELVSKYYKSHEWYPLLRSYDQISKPDNATYTPSWGPKHGFGIFTCFDIMWPDPAVKTYIDEMQISHFLYPVQQGALGDETIIPHWSKQHSTTLLSANLGHSVSGIFKNGVELPYVTLYLDKGGDNIKIADVPEDFNDLLLRRVSVM